MNILHYIQSLTPKGAAMYASFIKIALLEEYENPTALDGYQLGILVLSLSQYSSVFNTGYDGLELSPEDQNFMRSTELVIKDQSDVLVISHRLFTEFLTKNSLGLSEDELTALNSAVYRNRESKDTSSKDGESSSTESLDQKDPS